MCVQGAVSRLLLKSCCCMYMHSTVYVSTLYMHEPIKRSVIIRTSLVYICECECVLSGIKCKLVHLSYNEIVVIQY